MITNDIELSPGQVWREYRPQANDDNMIKELKEGYGIASFNLNNFWATETVIVMNSLVFHNLFHYLNRNILNYNPPPYRILLENFQLIIFI
jgi:hypothetical protein